MKEQLSKKPSFRNLPEKGGPITRIALLLVASKKDQHVAFGTATVIAPYIAITAKHVVEAQWEQFEEGQELFEGSHGNLVGPSLKNI